LAIENNRTTKRISVFGGSSPQPGESAYLQAQELGVLIGRAGFIVLTGGYSGTMEAVSRGAAEAGGHVIGVTCELIEAYRPIPPNPWVLEELRCATLRQRMFNIIDNCDLAIALPGGIGTLAEISAMWGSMQTGEIPARPLILVGGGWERIITYFFEHHSDYVKPAHRELLSFAADVQTAFRLAESYLLS